MSEPDQQLEIVTTTNGNGKNNPQNISEDSIDFTLLRLDGFNSSAKTNSTTTQYHTPCTLCGCSCSSIPAPNISSSSNKRRSHDSTVPNTLDSQNQIPKKPKKLFLDPHEIPPLNDFSKITLPCSLPVTHINPENQSTTSVPDLRRCYSDPNKPPVSGSESISGFGAGGSATQVPQSPPESARIAGTNALKTPSSNGTASLPPRPPILKRTFSDPSPNKSFSRSSSSGDFAVDGSSQYKWLRRMRDCMKEMNQWWDEVLPQEEIPQEEEDKGTHDNSTDTVQADLVTEFEESVIMERTGDCLVLRFKCPCSKGYQILLSGSDCYYKLL